MKKKNEETQDEMKKRLHKDTIENGPGQKNFDEQISEFKNRAYQRQITGENVMTEQEEKKEEEIKYTVEDLAAMNKHVHDDLSYVINEISKINLTLNLVENSITQIREMQIETAETMQAIWHFLIISQAELHLADFAQLSKWQKSIEDQKKKVGKSDID